MNVAFHLKKLGVHPAVISRIGDDERGRGLLALLDSSDIDTGLVQTDATSETGWVHARQVTPMEMEYDIVQPVAWDFIEWQETYPSVLDHCRYFVYGSLASRNTISRNTLYHLLEHPVTKVLDINLRPPHYSRAGIEYLLSKADVLKMNEAELELVARWGGSLRSQEDMARSLQDQYSIPTIIVTLGAAGAMVLHEGQLHRHGGYAVPVADTIGSGDAFLAGFLSQRMQGTTLQDALHFACGLGALIATYHGACPNYQPSEIQTILAGNDPQAILSPIF